MCILYGMQVEDGHKLFAKSIISFALNCNSNISISDTNVIEKGVFGADLFIFYVHIQCLNCLNAKKSYEF